MPVVAPLERRERPIGTRRRDLAVLILFLLVLVTPAVAFMAGMRPQNEENRVLATPPSLSLSALSEPATFVAMDGFLADTFPLKSQMVWVNAALRYHVARTSPNIDVVVGAGRWLFSRDALEPECRFSAAEILEQIGRLGDGFAEAGIEIDLVVVPDKQAIYPEMRPPGFAPCTQSQKTSMISGMHDRPELTTELWTVLEASRSTDPDGVLFWPQDTHWSPQGGMLGVQAVVSDIVPGLWDSSLVTSRGTLERVGDLSRLMGLPTTDSLPAVSMEPPIHLEQSRLPTSVLQTPGRELQEFVATDMPSVVPGRTLLIHDSAFGVVAGLVAPWFGDSVWLHFNTLYDHPEIVNDLPHFDRVVIERVERYAYLPDYEQLLAPVLARAQAQVP